MATYHVARADGGGARWDVDAPDAEAAIQQVHACFREEAKIAAAFDPGSERAEMLVPPLIARRMDRPAGPLAALAGRRWLDGGDPNPFGGGLVWADAAVLPGIRRALDAVRTAVAPFG